MHDDSALVSERLERVRRTVGGHVWQELAPLAVSAWRVPGEPVPFAEARAARYEPFAPGTWWGRAWSTLWLHLEGEVPRDATGRLEVQVDLGFSGDWAGNQAEGMVYTPDGMPLKAVNPMNSTVVLPPGAGPVDLYVECAANPNLSHAIGHRTEQGDLATVTDELLYRFVGARLVRRRDEVHALALDLEVAHELMLQLPADSTRRARLLRALDEAADAVDSQDVPGTAAAARERLAGVLACPANASAQSMMAVGHAHIDSAWLWPVRETRRKTIRTFSNVLALAREYPDFHFACTTAQQYEWVRQDSPETFQQIREAIARGQWHPVGGMWVEADANLPSGESLVRQFTSGLRWMQQHLDVRPTCLWLPDSFGYTAALPQIARLAGMEWFFTQKLSWNRTNVLPHHTFWWEGLDGTRIWTHFPPVDCYDSVVSPAEVKKAEANFKEKGRASWSLLPYGYGDGGGGPTREMVERLHRMGDLEEAPHLVSGSPEEFFAQARDENPDLPTWSGELYLEFHRGTYTSQAAMKRGNRRSEHLLAEVEALAVLAARRGTHYPHAELERAWRTVLLQQFHDILPGSSIAWVHQEARADHERVATDLAALRDQALAPTGEPTRCVVNASGIERAEVVALDGGLELVQVPAHATQPLSESLCAPSHPVEVRRDERGIVLDNGLLEVVVDHDGLLPSVWDLVADRQLLLPGRRGNLLQLHHDLPCSFDAWELEQHYRHSVTDLVDAERVEVVEQDRLRARVVVERRVGRSRVRQSLSLAADSRCLDVETTIDWAERERVLKLSFPLAVQTNEALAEIQFGHLARPIHDNTSWDAARFEVWAHRWMLVRDARYGVAVANDSTYGHDVTPTRGSDGQRGVDLRLTLLRGPESPDPRCDIGTHQLRHGLVAGADVAAAHREGIRLNMPLRLATTSPAQAPVVVESPDVVLDALKEAFDESGDVVVRLHEAAGARTRATLRLGWDVQRVTEVDLLEDPVTRPTQTLPPGPFGNGERLVVELHPFQILTLRLTLREMP